MNDPSCHRGKGWGRLTGLFLIAGLMAVMPTAPSQAVTNDVDATTTQDQATSEDLVRDIQDELRRMGFYNGPVDGVLGPLTSQAISQIQRASGWPVDGLPSPELLELLYTQQDRAQALLDHIDVNRIEQISDAREILATHDVTSDLLNPVLGGPFLDNIAEETCASAPTTACLLEHAIAAARAMNDVERRSFALIRIAEIQVRMGQIEAARQTLRRVRDPRYVINALDVLAMGLSSQGHYQEALDLIDVVPIVRVKLAGLDAIARTAKEDGQAAVVDQAVQRARAAVLDNAEAAANPWRLIELAKMLDAAGEADQAQVILDRAASATAAIEDLETRDRILPEIVQELLAFDQIGPARALAATIETPHHRAIAELALVRFLVERGSFDDAHEISEAIEPAEYRSLALAASAGDDDHEAAKAILAEALDAAQEIPFKRRRDEAFAVIAQGQAAAGDPAAALATSGLIGDDSLRARTLFAMADDNTQMVFAARRAMDAVDQAYYRSLLQLHLALEQSEAGDTSAADESLDQAVASAFSVSSDAYRALALAQSAETLSNLRR